MMRSLLVNMDYIWMKAAAVYYLPQVATEHKMNREEFLTAICHKSGLYGEYWKERTLKIKVFTAEIFSEEETEMKK